MLKYLITTTALVAATPLAAQMVDTETAKQRTIEFRAANPDAFEALKQEIAGGLTAEALTCADPAACQPGDLMVTPGGQTVRLAEGGMIYPSDTTIVAQSAEVPVVTTTVLPPVEQNAPETVPETTPEAVSAPEPEMVKIQVEAAPVEETIVAPEQAPPEAVTTVIPTTPEKPPADTAVSEINADEPEELRDTELFQVDEEAKAEQRIVPESVVEAQEPALAEEPMMNQEQGTTATAVEPTIVPPADPEDPMPEDGAVAAEPEVGAAPQPEAETTAVSETPAEPDTVVVPAQDVIVVEPQPAQDATPEADTPVVVLPPAEPETAVVPADDVTVITPTPDPAAPVVVPDQNAEVALPAALQDGAKGEVVEVTVSEDQARSSAEDFANKVNKENQDLKNILFGVGGFALGQALADRSVVALNTGDRIVVVNPDGQQRVLNDDGALLVQPGYQVSTEKFADGSSLRRITRPDGSVVITVHDASMRVLSRRVERPDGETIVLIDQTQAVDPVDVKVLPPPAQQVVVAADNPDAIRRTLLTITDPGRTFSLDQVLTIKQVRDLAATVNVSSITFATGSAAITQQNAQALSQLGAVIKAMVEADPREVFLVEGHTDSVGDDAMNLALSDRRAESVAKALVEYFGVPAENLVVQGYGENFLLVPQEGDIRENRRVAVRRITDLIMRR